ncbi:MAG TPA: hypothetical protein VEX68_29135 [Bryobacteraceae bacterium]|nr:hypothetical protein [Bryobacteraceae bacterium]
MPNASLLIEYSRVAFRPAVAGWEKAQSSSEAKQRFAAASLIESYGWIIVGVQVTAFPADLARQVMIPHVQSIAAANVLAERESLFQSGLTAQNRVQLRSEETFPPSFAAIYPSEFAEFPEAPSLFSQWCLESLAFAQSDGGFAETLNFALDQEWEVVLGRLRDEPFLLEVATDSERSLFEGYLRALLHMNRMADLMGVDGARTASWPARALMRVSVGDIHGWRLNLTSGLFETRFDSVTEAVEARLRAEATADAVELEKNGFIRGVRELRLRYAEALGYLSIEASD